MARSSPSESKVLLLFFTQFWAMKNYFLSWFDTEERNHSNNYSRKIRNSQYIKYLKNNDDKDSICFYFGWAVKLKVMAFFQCLQVIENSLEAAKQLIADVDLQLLVHNQYGKGFMKVCRVSPDAYIQLALQLAYYRVRVYWLKHYKL